MGLNGVTRQAVGVTLSIRTTTIIGEQIMKSDTIPVDLHTVKSEKMKNSVIDAIGMIKEGGIIPMTEKLPGWVQKMMGHETLQMIHDRYYSYIKNYQRDDGSAFMEKVYQSFEKSGEEGIGLDDPSRKCAPKGKWGISG